MLTGDAVVATLRGTEFVADLADRGPTKIFTWDGDRITIGEIEVGETQTQISYALDLDDGNTLRVSSETMVLLRNGAPRYPEQLEEDTSLLPLYFKFDGDNYTLYRQVGDWRKGALTTRDSYGWRRLSRMIAEWKMGRRCQPGDVVSFVDGNRTNHDPENIKVSQKRPRKPKRKQKFAEPVFKAHEFIRKHNHKLVQVRLDTSTDLFSIRGLDGANLAVNGIFVSVDTE